MTTSGDAYRDTASGPPERGHHSEGVPAGMVKWLRRVLEDELPDSATSARDLDRDLYVRSLLAMLDDYEAWESGRDRTIARYQAQAMQVTIVATARSFADRDGYPPEWAPDLRG